MFNIIEKYLKFENGNVTTATMIKYIIKFYELFNRN